MVVRKSLRSPNEFSWDFAWKRVYDVASNTTSFSESYETTSFQFLTFFDLTWIQLQKIKMASYDIAELLKTIQNYEKEAEELEKLEAELLQRLQET